MDFGFQVEITGSVQRTGYCCCRYRNDHRCGSNCLSPWSWTLEAGCNTQISWSWLVDTVTAHSLCSCLPSNLHERASSSTWKGHFQPSNISKKKGGEMGVESTHPDTPHSTPSGPLRGESHGHVTVNWHGDLVCQGLPTCVFSRNTILPSAFNFRIYVSLLWNSTVHYFFLLILVTFSCFL